MPNYFVVFSTILLLSEVSSIVDEDEDLELLSRILQGRPSKSQAQRTQYRKDSVDTQSLETRASKSLVLCC